MRRAAVVCVLSAGLANAQSFVVDAANGPGANFTSISAAVAAVPDGATLLVRPGTYGRFDVNGKGLTILGGAGVQLFETNTSFPAMIQVRNTLASQPVVVRGFTFTNFSPSVGVANCSGSVLLEDVALGTFHCNCVTPPQSTLGVANSSQVIVRDCVFWHGNLFQSDTVLERCSLNGYGPICGLGSCGPSFIALTITGGTTQIADCNLQGGTGVPQIFMYPMVTNKPAIAMQGGALRILARSTIIAGNTTGVAGVVAIQGTGSLRIDPAVTVQGGVAPAIDPTLSTVTQAMPVAYGTSASPGGTATGTALGPVGNVVVLLIGLRGPPVLVPGIVDEFWLDPGAFQFAAFGVPQVGVPITVNVPVPNLSIYLGFSVGWQSVSSGAAGLEASNPTLSLIR